MSNLLRKASMLTGMVVASGSMMLAAAPSYAGNSIQMEAIADVIPACDILGQTVGRLVESVPGDGDTAQGFTRGRLVSSPNQANIGGFDTANARGQLAYVGLTCTGGTQIMATVTSPVQISGTTLDINVATTSMYAAAGSANVVAANIITSNFSNINANFANANPVALATSGPNGAVATSDAAFILGTGSAYGSNNGIFGFGFNIEVNGDRIPAGQYGIASTLTVVPR